MKILLACSNSSVVVTFRKSLIKHLKSIGHDVSVLVFDREYEKQIKELGVSFYCINDANRSLNPFKVLTLKLRYAKVIKEINPDLVFTFMLKPNIYGVQGAKKAGVDNIYSMVEGTGDVFINNGLKWKLIRKIVCMGYKKAFKSSKKVFFLNNDDKSEFIKRGLVKEEQCQIVHGIGVDLEHFEYKAIENTSTFLMIARLLKTKGVYEYCEAARIVKEKYPNAIFNLVGPEGTVKADDLKRYIEGGIINYLGETNDVRPYIEESSVYVLPSYREGFSVSIMEAQAVGRAVITCDTNGTRDAVRNGEDGFLVSVKNSKALADRMIYFLENPDKIYEMGSKARSYSEQMLDYHVINDIICTVIGATHNE